MKQHRKKGPHLIKTNMGDMLASLYDSAYEVYHDERLAERIATQTLWRKLRQYERAYHNFPR